jgi:hypothetical protein
MTGFIRIRAFRKPDAEPPEDTILVNVADIASVSSRPSDRPGSLIFLRGSTRGIATPLSVAEVEAAIKNTDTASVGLP